MIENEKDVCAEPVFQRVFTQYGEQLRNFLIYRGSEAGQAEDIVQESFIKLWENCAKVIPSKAKSYLYTLASNAFKNDIAHMKVRMKYAESGVAEKTNIETPEFKMEEDEFKERLQNAIAELVPTQREVFLMNRIDKKKYAEIAEELGISVKAVEKRMGKALKILRSKIKELK
ncbi:MAG: RNA polymerase sigma-70 factor [Crocinitomicaceae bacterium]|nr:RNA polymerase sigma-70 factor [Crocinitomicaceae bacterium]